MADHWSEELAEAIVTMKPSKEEYVCAAGISPSGSVHIGNFRDVATSLFVARALQSMGKRVRILFSWDDFDRFRKVPKNVAVVNDQMDQYIGFPYCDVPDPFGCCGSYAEHFEKEFMEGVSQFNLDITYRRQSQMYRSGAYSDAVVESLRNRREIFDVLSSFRTQETTERERESYYPVAIYCPECHRDTTHITWLSEDCTHARYECSCGCCGEFNFLVDFNCKLAWKIDWPMRWRHEGVDFEPGGKDHASPLGSYNTSRLISERVFKYPAPLFQGYEFIGIKGATGKMSSSSGINMTPSFLLNIYQPELILWLYARTDPLKAFDFCLDDGILRQYSTFDRMLSQLHTGKLKARDRKIMELARVEGRELFYPVSMTDLVQFGSIVNFNEGLLEEIFKRIGKPCSREQFSERLSKARYWLEECDPSSMYRLRKHRNWQYYTSLSEREKHEILELRDQLQVFKGTLDELQTLLYDMPKAGLPESILNDPKLLKSVQTKFFKNVYNLLLSRDRGPRLYLFLSAFDVSSYGNLLSFDSEITTSEISSIRGEARLEANAERDRIEAALNDGLCSTDDLAKLGVCVEQIVAAEEIEGSDTCYKITCRGVNNKRTVVSCVRDRYTAEGLLGKKVLVVGNMRPREVAGVKSDGMLLAAKFGKAQNYWMVFIDEQIPNGAIIF